MNFHLYYFYYFCYLNKKKKWLIENKKECPHCRARLMIEDLVPCRFVDEWKTVCIII